MNFNSAVESKNQQVFLPVLEEKKVELFIKREDLIHPYVSGNKFRKLKYNLQEAKKLKKKALFTYGGAFSNHIVATAVAGKIAGFKTFGIIRGDELGKKLEQTLEENATLREAHKNGMKFQFVSREQYRQKLSFGFVEKMKNKWGDFYVIPEGGTNCLAVDGCEEILNKEDSEFNYICSAVGTGGTISGLINASKKNQKIIGFPALKGNFLSEEIKKYVGRKKNWSLQKAYHFGGYAKYDEELITFINNFTAETGILLDPIYTGKMLFGILDLVKKDMFSEGTKILAIHTGGIQGIQGINHQLENKNQELINVL
ncbi:MULTISPECIES: 1-aminocyclopropane-1-carboxylate deaminase/D-cysteine desulfhydrase [unclassified Polaribacter]|jgi:1-aminocyclopropane-1-carboxylate deaminase|uniref:1-aminocyclopropane-1-carboxylate deaminase/D-cysteine desulfhydrase n=1 Tax=unclassified Polaribacter TaxID=196858 RepID=UPI00052D4183|nr:MULTISPECIES: pyridoxal-phosphate dependent enzyme [unclassified Polaribacter]KGL59463.1 1-aminocyclopropane-1-carboxylate deaminase [Polaribacter sp. Hel1_33_49]MBT7815659.1 pyridoxal-phosphate dependent enzyme [Polaribacter sp.]PKV63943.1 1-aminocyclopropane-1-carboxylate deaminase [Polaribacter sp. Hel1_33_96]